MDERMGGWRRVSKSGPDPEGCFGAERTGHGGGSETENGTPTKCRDKSLIATG